MIVAGSRCGSSRRVQLDDRCGKLRAVKLLNAAGRSLREVEVGRCWLIEVPVLTVSWVNRGGWGVDLVANPYSESYVGHMLQC